MFTACLRKTKLMKHTVLARKWRPKKFADLIGQQNAVTILKNIINGNRIHHAYLLTGTRGVGKTTIARIIAKALNCLNPIDGEPCTVCNNCIQIDSGSYVDVIEIDAASNTGVDNIRELIDNARYSPTSGKYKIYIIDEVHMLSKSAFNAMLKTLEEPPAHVVFILATTDLQKVPLTILSRCLQLKLRNLLTPEIQQYLASVLVEEQEQFEIKALELIGSAARGSMRDALSLLDQAIAFSDGVIAETTIKEMLGLSSDDQIYAILDALSEINSNNLMQHIKAIYESGADLELALQSLQQKLCELNIAQLSSYNTTPELSRFVNSIGVNDIQLYFEIANLGLEQIKKTSDKYSVFVMTMLRMIAFNIGTSEEKSITINNSNFIAIKNETLSSETTLGHEPRALPKQKNIIEESSIIVSNPIIQEQTPDEITDLPWEPDPQEVTNTIIEEAIISPTQAITFNGNWFDLITNLKPHLGALYPFVENAQLKSHTSSSFDLIIDERYESAFNKNLITQFNQILTEYFSNEITLKIQFATKVSDTLKEKTLQEKQEKQLDAERSVNEDTYLVKMIDEFSAKIAPGSIKPII